MNILFRIKRKLRRESIEFVWDRGLLPVIHKPRQDRIVMYHGVDQHSSTMFNLRFCGTKCLDKQFGYLKERFEVVPLADYFDRNGGSTKPKLALTFDDGYANWLSHALPVIEKHEVPVSFFVTSTRDTGHEILWADLADIYKALSNEELNFLEYEFHPSDGKFVCRNTNLELKELLNQSGWEVIRAAKDAMLSNLDEESLADVSTYWKLLSEKEIKTLSESEFVEIGSHSRYHTSLGAVPLQDAKEELRHSKDYLENIIDEPVESLAYPSGSYTRELVDAAQEIGFTRQLAVNYLFAEDGEDDRIIDRIGLYSHMSCGEQMLELN